MADKTIGELTPLTTIDNDSLFVAEQNGSAGSVSGELLKKYARESVDADIVAAQEAAAEAKEAVESVKNVTVDVEAAQQAAQEAQDAQVAAETAQRAAEQARDEAESIAGGDFLSKAGGTLTGDLTLAGDPTEDFHAATKGYVDGTLRYALEGADDTPTEGSANIVSSGGVFTALEDKQDKITGAEGQVVGFDADGNAVAQDAPTSAGGSAEWRLAGSNTNCQDAYITNDPDDTFTLELDEEVDFSSISEFILIVGAASWTGTVPSNWSAFIVDQDGNDLPGLIVLGSDSTVQYRTWVHAIKCGEKWMHKVDSWETTGSAAKFTASYQATSATTVTAIKFVAPVAYEAKISNYSFVRLFVR